MMSARFDSKMLVVGVVLIFLSFWVLSTQTLESQTSRNTQALDMARLPSFTRVLLLEESSETSANVSIGDLNGDGYADIVLAKGRHWPLINRVLLNGGHGRFPVAHTLDDVADRSYSVTLADLDRDGDLDV